MKQLLLIIVFLFIQQSIVAQEENEIINLSGIIDSTGKYYLIYEDYATIYNLFGKGINFIDAQNNIDSLLVKEGFWWQHGDYGVKEINDYSFFSNNPFSLISVGFDGLIGTEVNILEADSVADLRAWNSKRIIVSKKKPNIVYLTAESYGGKSGYATSIDSGKTWLHEFDVLLNDTVLSTIPFNLLSLYPNSDSTMFGIDSLGNLIKSYDAGLTSEIVEESSNWNFLRKNIYYDNDLKYLYAITENNENYYLYVSDNYGNKDSWNLLFTSDSKISLSPDILVSGKLNFTAKNNIYQSTDYGVTYSLIRTFDYNTVGIFTVPNSDTIFIGSKYSIIQITDYSNTSIKSVISSDSHLFYPLNVGNKWIYEWSIDGGIQNYITTSEITSKEVKPNGIEYYHRLEENRSTYERIDTSTGIVYKYDETADSTNYETMSFSLTARDGDTILTKDGSHQVYFDEFEGKIFSANTHFYRFYIPEIKTYIETFAYRYGSCKRIHGLTGETTKILKGCIIDGKIYGDTTLTAINDISNELPTKFSLSQNYPNPFNPSTLIRYEIGDIRRETQHVSLRVYDILGREVATLVNKNQGAGSYEVKFNASGLTSGIYYYQIKSGSFVEMKKMIILK